MSSPAPIVQTSRRTRRLLVGVCVAGMAAAVVLFFTVSDRNPVERDAAIQLARDGRFEEAEPQLRKWIERNPSDVEVAEALARGSSKAGSDHTEGDLNRWASLQPDHSEPLQARLDFYRKQKDYERAYQDAKALLDRSPRDANLRRTVMSLAFSAGRYLESEQQCRELLNSQPSDATLRSMQSQIRRAQGDLSGAAAILDELLKEQPLLTSAMMSRAALFDEMGQPEKSVPLYREVMQRDSSRQLQAGYQLSLALERVGQAEEAAKVMAEVRHRREIEAAQEAMKSQPGNLDLEVRYGEVLIAAGRESDGLGVLQTIVARDRQCKPAHAALADYYDKHGDVKRAAEHRERAGSR